MVTEYDARKGDITTYAVSPADFGLQVGSVADLQGGGVAENVEITRAVLNGENGPRRSITLLNAGAGIYAANAAESFAEGIAIAAKSIDSGRALATLNALAALTHEISAEATVPA
jgi:anthranilate phosphoribosyltransferase